MDCQVKTVFRLGGTSELEMVDQDEETPWQNLWDGTCFAKLNMKTDIMKLIEMDISSF